MEVMSQVENLSSDDLPPPPLNKTTCSRDAWNRGSHQKVRSAVLAAATMIKSPFHDPRILGCFFLLLWLCQLQQKWGAPILSGIWFDYKKIETLVIKIRVMPSDQVTRQACSHLIQLFFGFASNIRSNTYIQRYQRQQFYKLLSGDWGEPFPCDKTVRTLLVDEGLLLLGRQQPLHDGLSLQVLI